jgi:hypothetical protein
MAASSDHSGVKRALKRAISRVSRLFVAVGIIVGELRRHPIRFLCVDQTFLRYRSLYLDTGPFMASAQRLYESNGFLDCDAYDGAEVPIEFHSRWRFMTRALPGDF